MKIEITSSEAKFLEDTLRERLQELRDRKNPPKGMTYGQCQDAMNHCVSIRAKLVG